MIRSKKRRRDEDDVFIETHLSESYSLFKRTPMNETDIYNLGIASIQKKKRIYLGVGLGLLIVASLSVLSIIFGDEELKNNPGANIFLSVVLTASGIVFITMMFLQNKLLKNRNRVIEVGRRINEENREDEERAKTLEEKEAALKAEERERKTPDFNADKSFEATKGYVWINTEDKLIQFSLPTGKYIKTEGKGGLLGKRRGSKEEIFRKTKVLNLAALADIELVHDYDEETTTDLHGYGLKADFLASGNAKIKQATTTNHYYQIEFAFNDLDEPVVHVFFNDDRELAERLYQTIKILTNKKA